MRLFVAIELNRSVEDSAREVIDELRGRVSSLAPRARITWVAPERLHVTVRFIGNADEERGTAIRSALAPRLETAAFDLVVEGVGAFPERGAPRVFWAGLHGGRQHLLEVEEIVSRRLASIVAREDRPYAPHLTLARVKDPAGLARVALFEGLSDRRLGRTRVDAITLFESRPSSEGPTYVPLQRTALRAYRG
jgi:2'-5' RNA ligase